ncbi:uncharacterized protein LOC131255665 isoform X2 [Magnolia sinica]|uniref:uncharacterized protein LOC131255665 isoform X2 n=1 Tax=Magnolia sinica TaxID=86752 RepID=UPI002659FD18|nr:uncharacterized protein LOC131255665 isoform X2 [Magnolia sinica]
MGRAINKIVMIVELIKGFRSSVPSSKDGKDHLYSLSTHVAGCILIPFSLETTRHVSVIKITFSKELDASPVGSGRFARLQGIQYKPLSFDEEIHI